MTSTPYPLVSSMPTPGRFLPRGADPEDRTLALMRRAAELCRMATVCRMSTHDLATEIDYDLGQASARYIEDAEGYDYGSGKRQYLEELGYYFDKIRPAVAAGTAAEAVELLPEFDFVEEQITFVVRCWVHS